MPRMSNGIGTWFCKAHFDPGWGWDDAVECAMFVFFPVYAHRVVHLRQDPGGSFAPDTYQAIPLRHSDDLVRHVFLHRWFSGLIGVGLLILLMLGLVTVWPPTGNGAREWAVTKPILTPLAPCLVIAGLIGQGYLRPHCRRQRDIRSVLGFHSLGSSDPATWVDEDLARMKDAKSLFGTTTYAEAAPKLLEAKAWSAAMWAARLTAAKENPTSGEQLTEEVLNHPGTQEALTRVRRDRKCWPEAMGTAALVEYRNRQGHAEQPSPEVRAEG